MANRRVDTQRYENSHSKKPSGWGQWLFAIWGHSVPVFEYNGLYSFAKGELMRARLQGDANDVTTFDLLP